MKIHPAFWVMALWILAFSLACRIATDGSAGTVTAFGDADSTVVMRMLGGSRSVLSGELFLKADNVFHKGIAPQADRAFYDWFTRLRDEIVPSQQAHLDGDDAREILPWLYFATRFDPANVTAFIVASYWLTGQIGRPELAEQLLREAHRSNPGDYRIYQEQGRLFMRLQRWDAAERALNGGVRRWPYPLDGEDEQARIDWVQMQFYMGLLVERRGDVPAALELYDRILDEFPARDGIRARRDSLLANGTAEPSPAVLFENLLGHSPHVCDHDHHDCNDHHDH